LDSCCALSVMRHLKRLAQAPHPSGSRGRGLTTGGRAVLVSIHQPRPAIWALIDQVSVLVGGCLLYSGPSSLLVPWIQAHAPSWGPYLPATHGTIPDWLLDAAALAPLAPKATAALVQMPVLAVVPGGLIR
ncbi:ABC transporter domain-containing protein, partial [Haematococcus lacustris]